METQPLALLLAFLAFIVTGPDTPLPLGEVSITLLLLGLQWWCMFINYRILQGLSGTLANVFSVLGIVVAYILVLVTNIATLSLPSAVVILAVVIFCWKRGVDKARIGLSDEQLILVFKLGLGVLLFVLCIAILATDIGSALLTDLLTYALPLFFLSGLIGLSFTRLGVIRGEQARQGIPQIDPTRGWLIVLTFLWGLLVAGAVALEVFSFGTIQALLFPIWEFLGTLIGWILYAILWLLFTIVGLIESLFHSKVPPVQLPTFPARSSPGGSRPSPNAMFPSWLFLVGRIVLVIIILVVLFLIVRAVLRQARPSLEMDSEEEIREALSVREVLRERRQEHGQQALNADEAALEPLDPESVRARYRELLQEMARAHLGRRPEETPIEYQKRLGAFIEKASAKASPQEAMLPDRDLLDQLTRAYTIERYGGSHAEIDQRNDLRAWIVRLGARLSGRAGTTGTTQP
jgi:Domain of unknown function (DUF4129)